MDASLRAPERTGTSRVSIRTTSSHVQNLPRPAPSTSTPSSDSRTPEAAPSGSAPTYTESSPIQNRPTMAMNASRSWSGGRADPAPRFAVGDGRDRREVAIFPAGPAWVNAAVRVGP
ncbi:hypothetical protein SVIOM74S_06262 [Streptomyces violarus]